MAMTRTLDVLVAGTARGEVLRLAAPVSFWGGVDPETGRVVQAGHPSEGADTAGRVLVLPALIGSSSSSAILVEVLRNGVAPAAILLPAADAILPIGALVAAEMGWPTLPILAGDVSRLETGMHVAVAEDGTVAA